MATNSGTDVDTIVYSGKCSRCGHTIRRPFPSTRSLVADKDGRWIRCADCGKINFVRHREPAGGATTE